MAALDFPASPTVGQIYTANGRSWKWDGVSWISANQITSIGVTGSTLTIYGSPIAHPDATSMTFANSVTLTAASTKTLTLNGGAGSNGLVINASNNVGIGTSSPLAKLSVGEGSLSDANVPIQISSASSAASWVGFNKAGAYGGLIGFSNAFSGLTTGLTIRSITTDPIVFTVNNTVEAMFLNSSGNLGLGVTPSAWDNNQKVLQVASSSFYGYSNGAIMASNGYFNASWKYITSTSATYYSQTSGAHQWYTSTNTPTVGGAITFNQAMTLDASGNLLVAQTNTPKSGTNTKALIKNAGIGGFTFSGTSVQDTGISVNAGGNGNTLIFLGSCNFSAGTNTKSAVYIISFYFDGNNTPAVTYVGGAASFLTFGQSATNTLTVTNSTGGNTNVSWFSSAG